MSTTPEHEQSFADFLRLVRASGLVEPARLDALLAPWLHSPGGDGQPTAPAGPLPAAAVAALVDAEALTPWQVEQLRKGKHKGFMLGKYKLLRLLGAGGMSSVYLAENTTLRQKVAIKVLPMKRVDKTSYLARFEREAQAAFRLGHHNIARAFDLDFSGTVHFIVMEYVDGVDLYTKVKQEGPLDVREAADFIRQAAVGLQYAHEEGFVHRDIKPANLILDRRGTIKILDLGLALGNDDEDASLTREHDEKVLGTADYLAPEQARDSHTADARSDVYALGCTFYYLLTGTAPFAKGSLGERIRAHLTDPPPNLLDTRGDVPAALAELYFRMMEKHPEARPQSAREVAEALDRWLATTGPNAGSVRSEPPRRPVRRGGGSGVSGSHVVRSGPSSSGGLPRLPAPSGSAVRNDVPAIRIETAPAPTITVATPSARGRSRGRGSAAAGGDWRRFADMQVAGQPVLLWIVMGVASLAIIGLLIGLALRRA